MLVWFPGYEGADGIEVANERIARRVRRVLVHWALDHDTELERKVMVELASFVATTKTMDGMRVKDILTAFYLDRGRRRW